MQNKDNSKGNNKNFVKNKKFHKFPKKKSKKPNEDEEIERLKSSYENIDTKNIKTFADIPLSWKTMKGLKDCKYQTPTDIQKESIAYGLQGRDVLGAAVTGSGKTLAFLIPVLENLFLKKWSRMDGIGAIIISPTRELAYQIFETLKKVGAYHDFSAGLIIGGKNLKFERKRMDQCNILICTPGRLLQHMDENPLFNADSMSILVLDEADRCLDMGFETTMNAIIEHLPQERQTLLFSATQTKSVKDLVRLSLVNQVYVAPHEQQMTTPEALQQNYVVVNLEDKITMIWSFIKNHLKQKVIVFLTSCKQVKYIYEIFCKMRPGTSILALYGTLHQDRRVAIYNEFCRKSNVVLFATDIASRGLDFPVVNWVIQLDCPEDVTQYIHRAGRTARHKASGESLLVLLPTEEEAMVEELKNHKIPINKIYIDTKKLFSPKAKMEAFLAQNMELKASAQRAFVSYIKSVVLMKNKKIFDVDKFDIDAFAYSLGLAVVPRVRYVERLRKMKAKKEGRNASEENGAEESSSSSEEVNDKPTKPDDDEIKFEVKGLSDDSDGEDNLVKIKRRNHEIADELSEKEDTEESKSDKKKKEKKLTKAALAKRIIKKKIIPNKKVVFDEEGNTVKDPTKDLQSEIARKYEENYEGGIDIEKAKMVLKEEDAFDKRRFKQLVKIKRKLKKEKLKKGDQDEMDDFGSDEDSLPDLSWVPDPDEVYEGPKSGEDDSEDEMYHKPSNKLVETKQKKKQQMREVVNSSDEDESEEEMYHKLHKSLVETKRKKPHMREVVNSSDEDESEEEMYHKLPKKLVETKNRKQQMREVVNSSDATSDDGEEMQPAPKRAKKLANKLSVDEAEMLAMKLLEN